MLAWWIARKEHIFRAFKRKNAPNLAEVVHSAWVARIRTQLSLFESAVMITNKHMLKGCSCYRAGSFGGVAGPSNQCLDQSKRARNDSFLTKFMQSSSGYVNEENECSPPQKNKTKEKEHIRKRKFM